MAKRRDSKVWLFSFSDLAFLLLLAFTQASTLGDKVLIGEIDLPVVDKKTKISKIEVKSTISYQIAVNKPANDPEHPYQIIKIVGKKILKGKRIDTITLKIELSKLKHTGIQRPILIPDKYSLSKDTITGISILQQIWNNSDKVLVEQN